MAPTAIQSHNDRLARVFWIFVIVEELLYEIVGVRRRAVGFDSDLAVLLKAAHVMQDAPKVPHGIFDAIDYAPNSRITWQDRFLRILGQLRPSKFPDHRPRR